MASAPVLTRWKGPSYLIAERLSEHRSLSPEGFLIVTGTPIARTGVQTYQASEIDDIPGDQDRMIEVYRLPEEVFSPSTIASFEGKTVTTPHPPVMLTAENDSAYNRGHAMNVRRGGVDENGDHLLICDLWIKDATLKTQLNNGSIAELSSGYRCEWVPANSDDPNCQVYYQRNIVGNHIAVVPTGRAGSSVRVLDSAFVEDKDVSEPRFSLKQVTAAVLALLPGGGSATTDAESEAVKRNEVENEEAKKRAERRNFDEGGTEVEKEEEKDKKTKDADEAKAEEMKKAEAKDAEEKEEKKKDREAMDGLTKAVSSLVTSQQRQSEMLNKFLTRDAGCNCGAKEGEAHDEKCPMFEKKETEDAELIPVETLSEAERPKNPIPGADAALAQHLVLKSVVASSGSKEAKDAWNKQYLILKNGGAEVKDGYGTLLDIKKPDEVRDAEERSKVRSGGVNDSAKKCADFEAEAAKYRGKNVGDVKKGA